MLMLHLVYENEMINIYKCAVGHDILTIDFDLWPT